MKKFISILLLSAPIFILVFCTATTTKQNKMSKGTLAKEGFAVIELFTSQGCSSCPPADKLLGRYADKENVYALSFHVDYWNRLGWKDPFSNHEFTNRQTFYVNALNASGAYTPQAVINGETEMVGSEESKIQSAVDKFQSQESSANIIISDVKTNDNNVTFSYNIQGKINGSVLNIALVQNKIITSIKAGENEGVTLTNYNVVRVFKTIDLKKEMNAETLQLPAAINKNDLTLILFAQQTDGKIYAAAKSLL